MDHGFLIRPRTGLSGAYTARDPVTVREAVETELDAARSVMATGQGSDGRPGRQDEHRHHDPRAEHGTAEVVVDPATRERIYRERDIRAPERAHPDQAILRQRAYGRPPAPAEGPPPGEPHADIEA